MRKNSYWKLCPRWIPTRALIALMCFTNTWTSYMCRLQMPILAVPMINITGSSDVSGACTSDTEKLLKSANGSGNAHHGQKRSVWLNPESYTDDWLIEDYSHAVYRRAVEENGTTIQDGTTESLADETRGSRSRRGIRLFSGEPFDWSPTIRGQLLAAYSYGNVPGNFIGGVIALKFGPRSSVFWTALVAAVISLFSPLIAQIHWGALLFTRVIVGFTGGITFPACHTLVAKWAPPEERGRFIWSLLGGTFGTIFTYPMVAGIAESINWEMGWYLPSILMLIWIVFWMLLAYDSPEEHPGITDEEKQYILSSQAGIVKWKKPSLKETPILKICTSIPFISLVICHFGNLFLLMFYQYSMMLYLTKALGFQLTKGGFLASLPWFARILFGFFFSWAGDRIKKKQLMSIAMLRKGAAIFSHLIPGVCLIIVGYLGCSFIGANVFLFLALGFNGAAAIGNLANNQDLAPNYAGFLYGIMNTIGCFAGIIIPPMVEAIAGQYGNPIEKWQIVFWIGACVTIATMVIFFIGGSGKVQPWNDTYAPDTVAAEGAEAEGANAESEKAQETETA
ncbi:sialin [Orussus abietinus]|uniref:sialin n=1 Tax=Orussus abietinus TaxID=222816 RepID=UPI0006265763|nr:sialin [Orussus abietinus]